MLQKWLFIFLLIPLLASGQVREDSLNNLASVFFEKGEYDSALVFFKEELKLTRGINLKGEARALVNMGVVYLEKNDLDNAMECFENSSVIGEKINDQVIVASCYLSSGMVHERKASYLIAKQRYLKAAVLFRGLQNWDGLSSAYNSIGNIQNKLGEFRSALYYYQRSLDTWTSLKDSADHRADIAASLNNIGDLYKKNGQYDKALLYLTRALIYKREIGNNNSLAHTLAALGEVYEAKGNGKRALNYYMEARRIREKAQDRAGIANVSNLIASAYLSLHQYALAEMYLSASRTIAAEDSLRGELLKNYDLSRELYRNLHQPDLALHYDELYIRLNRLILDEATIKALKEMEVKYETAENIERNERLAQELKKKEEISFLKTGGIIGLVIILLLILLAFYQNVRGKKKVESLMRELNHRVKNNMQVLSGMLDLQHEQLVDEKARAVIRETLHRVNAMAVVHRKLYLDKEISLVNVDSFIRELTHELRMSYGFEEINSNIRFDLDHLEMPADKAIPLGLVLNEILSNAFKHAFRDNPHPALILMLKKTAKSVVLTIADNGKGMSAEDEQKQSFGYKLIRMMCRQLHARLEQKNLNGTQITITMDNM